MSIREQILQMAEQEGIKQGRREGHKECDTMFVENLLRNTDFSDKKLRF